MKPLGMTADFRVVRPTLAQDRIWDAVDQAISEGMNPTDFIREVRECWEGVLSEQSKAAVSELNKALMQKS